MFPSAWISVDNVQSLPGFPYTAWTTQRAYYGELRLWEDGTKLIEWIEDTTTGDSVEKYPIGINPIKNTAEKHTSILFGETPTSSKLGGLPVQIKARKSKPEDVAKRVNDAILNTLSASGAGSLFVSNALISQTMGGCFFQLNYMDDQRRILVSAPHPAEIFAIPEGTDYLNFRELWLVREVNWYDAQYYGLEIDTATLNKDPSTGFKYVYVEHWTKTTYEILINGQGARVNGKDLKGINSFGFVPFVYIPHLRRGGFLGESIISPALKGILREINLRFADVGDAVNEDSHGMLTVANMRVNPTTITILGRKIVNLGSTPGLSANESKPEMNSVNPKSASEPMLAFNDDLYEQYRFEANHPAVADGVDQGSQRSSATLNQRMWPLTSHVEHERTNWDAGLNRLCEMILSICALKGLENVLPSDVKTKLDVKWAPKLQRDRESITNEASIRATNKLGSKKRLMEQFGDIDDLEDEWAEVLQEEKDMFETKPAPVAPIGGPTNGSKPQPKPAAAKA